MVIGGSNAPFTAVITLIIIGNTGVNHMEQRIKALREQMEEAIGRIDTKEKLAAFWQEFLGKKGAIADLIVV